MSQPSAAPLDNRVPSTQKPTRYRWIILTLLFFATTINYLDRSIMNVVGPTVKDEQHWTSYQYGLVSATFTLAYAIGFIVMGRIIDGIGVRIAYAFGLVFWSLAACAHALATGPFSFGVARFFLGLGEAANFPAAVKTVAEWFPQKERATATGIFNAGTNVGAILAPLLVPLIVALWHWQAAFIITGLIGIVWVFFWLPMYRSPEKHPRVNQAELEIIQSTPPALAGGAPVPQASASASQATPAPVKWRQLLPYRQAWAFMMGKFLTDPIWYFYNFFAGLFFTQKFDMKISTLGWPLIIIYFLADFGSIAGGWLSSTLIARGWTPNAARKTAMFTCALSVLPVIYAPITNNWVIASILIGIAASAHQGFSANIFTLTSDMFPKRAVGSVVGLGGFAGAIGGMLMATVAGLILEIFGNFVIMFIIAGVAYLLAVVVVHLLVPSLTPLTEQQLERTRMPLAVWAIVWAVAGFLIGVPGSYQFQNHENPRSAHFPQYMAEVLSGDVFRITTPPAPATATAPATAPATLPVTTAATTLPATANAPTTTTAPAASAAPRYTPEEQRAHRAEVARPLIFTPLASAVLMAMLGMLVHGVLLRPRKAE